MRHNLTFQGQLKANKNVHFIISKDAENERKVVVPMLTAKNVHLPSLIIYIYINIRTSFHLMSN